MLGRFVLRKLACGLLFRLLAACFLAAVGVGIGSARQQPPPVADPFQHYAAARQHLAAGEDEQASAEFNTFLSLVVHGLASATAQTGHLDKATPLFEEAVNLAPADINLRMEYSRALFNQSKFLNARAQAQDAVRLDPQNPQAILLLGQVLYQLRDYAAARTQLESAFGKNPDFATGYLLGKADLLLHDDRAARAVFAAMLRQWGDTEINHIFLGRAYSQAGYANEAVTEFHRALEINPEAKMAHYQLALSYLREDEAAGYDQAIPEFRAELALNPDDFSSHYMLGYIAVKQSRWDEAEKELRRAVALRPKDLGSLISLADTYVTTNRAKDAEPILRQALAIAGNQPTQEVVRAHYLLGRILLAQSGHQDEAKHELAVVAELQKHSGTVLTADARAAGAGSLLRQEAFVENQPVTSQPEGPEAHAADDLRATIADAYNNLGAIAGNAHDFAAAANDFRRARQWNPALPGLDHNLGMALFYSSQYREAAPLLKTYVGTNPEDVAARAALGFTLFRIEDYSGVVACLKPIQEQMNQTPKLAFVYAASLARTGAFDEGISRLQALEATTPKSAEIHYELSQAYQHAGKTEDAAREMKLYEQLKPPAPIQPPK
ncbi:MAG TPA: tetratricopeptide repeat protein [Candidatus Dormibacteraeota bacterium]|nr:tetratricopeptide repeat protein [Candidatus Dormibacteraeota bacterium]